MICPICNKTIPDGLSVCPECSAPLPANTPAPLNPNAEAEAQPALDSDRVVLCSYCGVPMDADAEACPSCGLSATESEGQGAAPLFNKEELVKPEPAAPSRAVVQSEMKPDEKLPTAVKSPDSTYELGDNRRIHFDCVLVAIALLVCAIFLPTVNPARGAFLSEDSANFSAIEYATEYEEELSLGAILGMFEKAEQQEVFIPAIAMVEIISGIVLLIASLFRSKPLQLVGAYFGLVIMVALAVVLMSTQGLAAVFNFKNTFICWGYYVLLLLSILGVSFAHSHTI